MTSPVSAIEAIEKAMEGVTPGPWEVYDGCSWRRIGTIGRNYHDCAVLAPTVASDGHPDLTCAPGNDLYANLAYIAACSPDRMREVLALARKAEALQRENAEKENARSEQWRMRREAEASRDTERATSHTLKLERDELVTAMEGIVHFGDSLNFREDHLSKALGQWIAAGGAILEKINAAHTLIQDHKP